MAGSRIKGITVEIGGDTTKLQTALKGVNSEIRNTQAALKDVEKLLKLDPGNTELLTQKQKLLKDAIAETKEKLATLKTAAEQANEALQRGEISQAQYDALQREIAETEAKLKDLEAQASKSAVALEKIAATGTKLQGVGNAITGVGKSLAPISAAVTAVGVAGVKAATDWESAFAGVKKTTDATEEEYEQLAAGIQKMATETASSAEDIAAVAEAAGQLGISKEHLLEFTKTMVMLGDSTNLSADEAAVALARFLNITGESTSNVDRLGAAIVDLGNNFATDEASIVAMSTRLASAGTLAGLTTTDILALSTAMSSVGIEAEAGGTAMTQTLTAIEKAASDAANGSTAALDRIASVAGMSSADFAAAWERRPIEALQAFIAGLGQLDERGESATLVLDELGMSGVRQSNMLKSLALASGVLSDAIDTSSEAYQNNTALTDEASKRYETFASQVSQLKEAFKAVAVDIGNILIPILRNLMSVLQVVLNWWNNLSDGTKNFIVQLGSFIAILSPVLMIGGKIISGVGTIMTILPKLASIISTVKTAFGALNAVLAANPIILIIAAIAALVAAFIYLWNNCEEFRQFWIDLWEDIKAIVAAVGQWLSEAYKVEAFDMTDTPKNILRTLLSGTPFTVGDVDPTEEVTLRVNKSVTRRACVMQLVALTGCEIEYYGYSIGIRSHVGTSTPIEIMRTSLVQDISYTFNEADGTVNYSLSLYQKGDLEMGDNLHIVFPQLGIDAQSRIVGMDWNPFNYKEVSVTVGKYIPTINDSLYQIETTVEDIRQSTAKYTVEFGEIIGTGTLYFTRAYRDRPYFHIHTDDGSSGTVTLLRRGGSEFDAYIGATLSNVSAATVTLLVFYCTIPVDEEDAEENS